MKTSTIVWIIVIILVILGIWWWVAHPSQSAVAPGETATSTTGVTSTTETGTGAATSTASYVPGNLLLATNSDASLGTYLIADNGMTLYLYTKDTPGVSNCYNQCAVQWPPYIVASTDVLTNVQAGVTGKVGVTTRTDGTMQVTYNDMPLYFWIKDMQPGDTTGQNVGGVWYVVKP